ncbi:hypothetical protein Tco_0718654 [Tanacetum coccineum]
MHNQWRQPTIQDMTVLLKNLLIPLATKSINDGFQFEHDLKHEMFADLEYVQSLEKEVDELESDKAKFSNEYDLLHQEYVSKDIMCSMLHSLADLDEQAGMQFLYLDKIKECERLANELSKHKENISKEVYIELLISFAKLEKHSISLELTLQQCQEQLKNDKVWKKNESSSFRNEREQYFQIQDLKAQLQDKNITISELNKLIENLEGKFVDTKFDNPSVARQSNALRIPKPSVLGKPTTFSNSLERKDFSKTKLVTKTNVLEGLSKPATTQILPKNQDKISETQMLVFLNLSMM